ncbi:Os07g0498300 [Oryza sativa Japonica Group]|uniref:Os07g0498300 protein n=1 Tax=Oryza sativa subsp. japonica TaxID=39947 RepID=B7E3F3_ORYSJ|nr:unnamed protein product [Oryza sativa Japonica Group]BAT01621.1 Os07g0498300 [Oryza sativa Japonica Group]
MRSSRRISTRCLSVQSKPTSGVTLMMMMISYFHIGLSATRLFFFSLYGLYTWFGPSICSRRINTRLAISTAVL